MSEKLIEFKITEEDRAKFKKMSEELLHDFISVEIRLKEKSIELSFPEFERLVLDSEYYYDNSEQLEHDRQFMVLSISDFYEAINVVKSSEFQKELSHLFTIEDGYIYTKNNN